ncbi:MAG: DUF429 domain-containing protein [Crenarchaeota archaeon]|nr:DUF429 domain-containing protein [Thermoproteota archaeon]MCR8455463.1 DUF429 domain-containing protein [Thermoproteota archaeon]MCR8501622.1 DUF429 domain-containing protein [Thermoproteota archaeon]
MIKRILGLDPSGRDGKSSGFCLIYDSEIIAIGEFKTLSYLIEYIYLLKPELVAIDSPLNYPSEGPYRKCDLLLKKNALNPLPLNMPGMRQLIERALKIINVLEDINAKYIETFPAGALRMLGFRKPKSLKERKRYFERIRTLFSLRSIVNASKLTKDEFDAFICAVTGYAFTIGQYREYASEDCKIILPVIFTNSAL